MELAEYRRMHALEERHWWFRAKRRFVQALLESWGPGAGGRLLDVGCGTGMTLRELPEGRQGIGLDPEPEALALCRERGLTRLLRGSATAIPLADASVDAVLALDIVEHIEDDVLALSEIARVLRPGGRAVVTVPAFPFLWSEHDEALHHQRRYTRAVLERGLAQAGLAIVAGGYGHASVFPLAVLLRLTRRRHAQREAASDVRDAPAWLNALAYLVTGWEVPLIRRGRLPVGLSLVYVVAPRTPRRAVEVAALAVGAGEEA